MLHFLDQFNAVIGVLLFSAYLYQVFYTLYGLVVCPRDRRKAKRPSSTPSRRYAALICARNEEHVIGELVASLRAQDYPAELLDIYVLADNSTDGTARAARPGGRDRVRAVQSPSGRQGLAPRLDELISHIRMRRPLSDYDAFLVFDADNIVDPHFVSAMDQTFAQGCDVLTSYRNSKNFASSWISASYSIWFLREARFLNYPRMKLHTNCAISGTGFLVSSKIVPRKTAAGLITCSPRIFSFPPSARPTAGASAIATTRLSTTNSLSLSPSRGGSACAGPRASIRSTPIAAHRLRAAVCAARAASPATIC